VGAIEWTWLAWALEWLVQALGSTVLQVAALVTAAIVVWRLAVWMFRVAKAVEVVVADLPKMRALVHRELTDDGNGSVKSSVNRHLELMVAHIADEELHHHYQDVRLQHLADQLKAQGVTVTPLPPLGPRDVSRWVQRGTDRRKEEP